MSENTFGGFNPAGSFSTNNVIEQFLTAQIEDFTAMVVSYSVLLKPYEKKLEEVKRIAQRQVYPRVGLILSAAKDLDNNLLFSNIDSKNERTIGSENAQTLGSYSVGTNVGFEVVDSNGRTALENVYRNVTYFVTGLHPTSRNFVPNPFTEGITAVAAALTAAILIRQIPINSDIKNVDLGNDIEKRALEDLDRILKLYESGRSGSLSSQLAELPAPYHSDSTFYLALDIDKTTLPASYFDVEPVDEATVIEQAQPGARVKPLQKLSIPSDKIAFGWFYISSLEGETFDTFADPNNGSTVWKPVLDTNPAIERTFVIRDGWDADDIIEVLAEEINGYTLADNAATNIMAAPNRGDLMLQNVALTKQRMYGDTGDFARKIAAFRMLQQVNFLSFAARRTSTIVTREMVILRFFTLDKAALVQEVVKTRSDFDGTTFDYRGQWEAAVTYTKGDIVESRYGKEGQIYVCASSSIGGTDPGQITTSGPWVPVLKDYQKLREYKTIATPYVEGLVYGLNSSYTYLDKKGPKSLTLITREGNAKTLATKAADTDNSTNIPSASKDKLSFLNSDTFFFRKTAEDSVINGTLKIRLSSTDLTKIPTSLQPEFDPVTKALSIRLENVQAAEDVALAILEKLFAVAPLTEVLGALAMPNALQLTSFKKTKEETKEVIDILGPVPENLEIAIGTTRVVSGTIRVIDDLNENTFYQNAIEPKTAFSNRPRSLVILSTPIEELTKEEVTAQVVDNKDYGVARVTQAQKSERLQRVYDKLDFINKSYYSRRRDRDAA